MVNSALGENGGSLGLHAVLLWCPTDELSDDDPVTKIAVLAHQYDPIDGRRQLHLQG
jgi:hypothetical protein